MKKKLYLCGLTFLGLVSLTSCDSVAIGDEISNGIIDALIPNFWAFLTQFLAFIVLIVLVSVFAYKPIRKYLDKRADYLDNEVKNANRNNAEAKAHLEESELHIANVKKQAVNIVEEAKNSANVEKNKILNDANIEVTKMKEKAEKDIAAEKVEAQKEIKNAIISVALDASKHVLEREVNKDDNEKIIDNFVDTMHDAKNTESEIK